MKSLNKLFVGLGLMVACLTAGAPPVYAAVAGHVQFVSGDVQISSPSGQVHAAQKGDAINEGDTLTAAQKASAQIKMQDGGIVAVRPDTRMRFDQFAFAGKEDGSEKSFFSLFKGGFRAVTGLIGRVNKQNYRITTPAATIGIRGTDHETFVVTPDSPMAQTVPNGAYNKVNVGETYMTTERGTIFVLPNQMGFAAGMDQQPQLQPVNTNLFTVSAAPTQEPKVEKKKDSTEARQDSAATSEQKKETPAAEEEPVTTNASADQATTRQVQDEPIRETAIVDASPPAAIAPPVVAGPVADTGGVPVIESPAIVNQMVVGTGGANNLVLDTAGGTLTTGTGMVIPVDQNLTLQVQAASDAASLAAQAAQAAATAVLNDSTVLGALAQVNVVPATTAIGTASNELALASPAVNASSGLSPVVTTTVSAAINNAATAISTVRPSVNNAVALIPIATTSVATSIATATGNIGTAATAVNAATSLIPADLTLASSNASASSNARFAADQQALSAQAAYIANGIFADATAGAAITQTLNAVSNLRAADSIVQGALTTIGTQNAAMSTAQGAASTALTSANANLLVAQNELSVAGVQNAALTTAQGTASAALASANANLASAQSALMSVQTQNAALTAAQSAATTALGSATSKLTTANSDLTLANTQNAVIVSVQAAAAGQLTTVQTAATAAQAAAAAAAQAAAQAVVLQAAGDVAGVQAQLVIAQQQLALAQAAQASALAAQTSLKNQLLNAQTAQVAATNAVASATANATQATIDALSASAQAANSQIALSAASTALNGASTLSGIAAADATQAQAQGSAAQSAQSAATVAAANAAAAATAALADAATAGTQAVAAQAAATAAATALADSNTNLTALNYYVPLVSANALISAYNNPAVATLDRFVGVTSSLMPAIGGGFIEAYGPGAGFTGVGRANTSFVLDGAGNLVESRNAWYEQTPASSAIPQLLVADANIKYAGGMAYDTFKLADNSVYAGRWQGGTMTVSDNAVTNPVPIVTSLGASSAHWAIMLAPPAGYVQTLGGIVTYGQAGATSPTDANGNVGTLNNAYLTANFTAQLVDAGVNLTIAGKTLDVVALGMTINGPYFNTAQTAIVSCMAGAMTCPAAYYANLGGGFAGDGAASAGLNYTLWAGATPGATTGATDLIQGMVAFATATPPLPLVLPPQMTVVSNPQVWMDGYAYGVVVGLQPSGAMKNLVSIWGWGWANSTIGLDAANNLVQINRPVLSTDYFSGGTAFDTWKATDNTIYMGRWQGGSVTTVGYMGNLLSGPDLLGAGSAHWIVAAQSPLGYAQTLQGVATYSLTASTSPTDSAGNVGTLLPTSSLTVNFTAQLVNMALDIQFANKSLGITTPNGIAIDAVNNDAIWGSGMVACIGAGCDASGYTANLHGRLSGSTASNVALAYQVVAASLNDLVQGAAVFSSTGIVQSLPYVASNTAVAYTGSYGGGFNFIAAAGDLSPVGNPTYFREVYGQGLGVRTDTLNGATTTILPTTTGNGITFGIWETVTSVSSVEQHPLIPGGSMASVPGYMYGNEGYLDLPVSPGVSTGPLAGAFSYTAVAATSFDANTWNAGSVTTKTLTADFTNQTVSVSLGGTLGLDNWLANSTAVPISFMNSTNGSGARFYSGAPAISLNGVACTTCSGNINGAFLGQNYAGALVQYSLWDNAPVQGFSIGGLVGFDRMPVTGNPTVINSVPLPTNMFVVANAWLIDSPTAVVTDPTGVLIGWSGTGSNSVVTPATGSLAQTVVGTADVTLGNSGQIYWGTWGSGSVITNTFSYVPGPGQFHWITAPEPTPVYLAEVLTTPAAAYNMVGGDVTSLTMVGGGVHGTFASAYLIANFTTQTIAANLSMTVNGHNWLASTSNAPLKASYGNALTSFSADSYRAPTMPGYLTVTVDTMPANGSLAGQLVGAALDGAILRFNLDGQVQTPTLGYEWVQGVAAFQAAVPNDPATQYRMLAVSMNDPFALTPTAMIGGSYNNAARVVTDTATGGVLQFDNNSGGGSGVTVQAQNVPGLFAEIGSVVIGGNTISWGRWAPGTVVTITDRVTGVVQNATLAGGAHAILGPLSTAPVTLPVTGVYTYNLIGNTTPTTDTGALGTLDAATLTANFATQTVDVGVQVTAAAATLNAAAAGVPILNRANFSTSSMMTGPGALAVTCTGACGTSNQGAIAGGFGGAGGVAAGITYGFQKVGVNPGTVSGVAVFQQGAVK